MLHLIFLLTRSTCKDDLGIVYHNYEPFSVEEILNHMKTKTWKPIDHHGSADKLKEKLEEE
jgi:hypothetical protein